MTGQMICQNCGTQIEEGMSFCPKCGMKVCQGQQFQNQMPSQGSYFSATNVNVKKKESTLSTISAVLALFTCTSPIGIITAIIDLAVSGKKKNEKHTGSYFAIVFGIIVITVASSGVLEEDKKQTVDVSNISTETNGKTDSNAGKPQISKGQSFEKDGLRITVDDINKNFKDYNHDFQNPDKGKKYIKASFTYENNGDSDAYVSIYDYDCYADGELCEQTYEFGGDFINANISPTRKVTFDVYFEVPKKADSIELEYSSSFWTDEKVVIKVK